MRLAHGLELRDAAAPDENGLYVDFRALEVRTGTGNLSRRQPLGRAIGARAQRVVDATAGLGHDSVLLAGMGFEVVALERHPLVAEVLRDGVERALSEPRLAAALGDRLTVEHADAIAWLGEHREHDAVYIDPMFPPKRRESALAKKAIRLLRTVVGDDTDADRLLAAARAAAPRVVVKRHRHAPPIADDVHHAVRGSNVRYDVYLS